MFRGRRRSPSTANAGMNGECIVPAMLKLPAHVDSPARRADPDIHRRVHGNQPAEVLTGVRVVGHLDREAGLPPLRTTLDFDDFHLRYGSQSPLVHVVPRYIQRLLIEVETELSSVCSPYNGV